jgi:hypothetical protein
MKKSTIIINDFTGFNGSQIVCLEIANYLAVRDHHVTIRAERHSQLLSPYLHKNVVIADSRVDICDFDFVWAMHGHFALNTSDLEKLKLWKGTFISMHLSGTTKAESFHHYFSVRFSNCRIFNCENAMELLEDKLKINGKSYNLKNAAPSKFHNNSPSDTKKLKKLLIVSNHVPLELLDAINILKDLHIDVRHIGIEKEKGGEYKLIEPEDILKTDAVVTIGKSIQYALCSTRPVYCYDHFGGPGWLSDANFQLAEYKNFSGRCHPIKKNSNQIADELINGFLNAKSFVISNWNKFHKNYDLESFLDQFLSPDISNKFNCDDSLQQIDLMRGILLHSDWIWDDVFAKKLKNNLEVKNQEIVNLTQVTQAKEQEIVNLTQVTQAKDREINEILNSTCWKITSPLRFLARIKNKLL